MKNVHYLTRACDEILEAITDGRYNSARHTIELLDFVPTNDEVEAILGNIKKCLAGQCMPGVPNTKQERYIYAARQATIKLREIVSEYSAVTAKLTDVLQTLHGVTR